jgi:hypothetical protein
LAGETWSFPPGKTFGGECLKGSLKLGGESTKVVTNVRGAPLSWCLELGRGSLKLAGEPRSIVPGGRASWRVGLGYFHQEKLSGARPESGA